jgi:putative IMPACT (imprinted ancient) family translation regulator
VFYVSKLLSIYQVKIPYSDYSKNIDFWNTQMIKESTFAADVILNIAFYDTDKDMYLEKIKNLTQGKALISFLRNEFIDVIDN